MAKKPNKNSNSNKKQRPNYFENNIRLFGEDFLPRKTPIDIQKDAKKIFSDIAYGNIVVERDAKYFADVTFLQNLITVATDNLNYHSFTYAGMKQIIDSSNASQIESSYLGVAQHHQNAMAAYGIIVSHLQAMLNNNGVVIHLNQMMHEFSVGKFRSAFNEIMIVRDDTQRRTERRTY